jgi:hypothetical protein
MNFGCCNTSRALWLFSGIVVLAGAGAVVYFGRDWFDSPTTPPRFDAPDTRDREAVPVPPVRFTNWTNKAGIRFRHFNGMTDKKLLPETMGAGVIVLDYDNDGKPDLLFLNGCPWPGLAKSTEAMPTPALYRNKGDGTFEDVTEKAGPFSTDGKVISFFGMGGTAGDYDNDGYLDLFLTGIGGNHLFHNEGGKRFVEVADTVVRGPGGWPGPGYTGDFFEHKDPLCFSSSATWLDYDGDGKLDLFVCNYVTWSPVVDQQIGFRLNGQQRRFGQPTLFPGAQCFLYHNNGNGTFEDVSKQAGIEVTQRQGAGPKAPELAVGKSLGVIVCDADGDGWPDIIVANDTVRNFFFHNVEKGGQRVFEEIGLLSGVAYAQGRSRGAMGIDWAPLYRTGQNALLIGNFADEPDTFLCQDDLKQLQFSDMARAEGIAGPSQNPLKFGVIFFDFDLDGRIDFLTCNGHLDPGIGAIQRGQKFEQAPQLFWNTGLQARGFEPVTAEIAGQDLFVPLVGRGCAYLDFNGDGALDVVLTGNGGPPRLLRNDTKLGHHWLRLRLEGDGTRSNRSAIGAVVTLEAGGIQQRREVAAGRGYLSQSELVVTFGLGKATQIEKVTIRWPGRAAGTEEIDVAKLTVDHEYRVRQGKGVE